MTRFVTLTVFVSLFCLGVAAGPAMATTHTMTDSGAKVEIDINSSAGMYTWELGEVDHLSQQWFWYRIDDVGSDREFSIDTIDAAPAVTTAGTDYLKVVYSGTDFDAEFKFTLAGGVLSSTFREEIKIVNTSASPLDFHFFQYVDFDLGGSASGDMVAIDLPDTADQWNTAATVTETDVSPDPNRYEVNTDSIRLTDLEDGDLDDLNNTIGPLSASNVTWAFQWDVTLDADLDGAGGAEGGSLLISKDKYLVIPEPVTLALLGLGILAYTAFRSRRRLAD